MSAKKYLDDNGLLYLWGKIKALFNTKVDKVDGKGLSSNDFTGTLKSKLDGIASGAEVNVNADWNAASGDAQILNKPTIPTKTSDLTNDSGFITSADVPEGAAASTTTPKMDGTAATGSETAFARGDHVHPTDTTKQAKITASGILKGDGSGNISAAVAGTDYIASHQDISGKADKVSNATSDNFAGLDSNGNLIDSGHKHSDYLTSHQDISGKADKATTLSGYGITDAYTKTEVDAKVSSVYKPAGSVSAVSGLGALTSANEGKVYNFTASFTTTSDFVEGSGNDYPAGTNVVIVNTASSGTAIYKYDVLAGFVDLSGYLQTSDITEISNSEIDTIVAS